MRVELSAEADAQVAEIDAWWRENRLAATDELERAFDDLATMPTLGTVYKQGSRAVRRLLLHRTHYYLYFIEEADRLYVVAVWSCFRGRGPKL